MKQNWIVIAGIVVALIVIAMFVFLEDFSGPMVIVNSRTPFFAAGALICLIALIVYRRQKDDD